MNLQSIIISKFNLPSGTKIATFRDDTFGPTFGEVTTAKGGVVDGRNLVTSITVASRMVANIQEAIDAMQAVLDAGPIKDGDQ